MEYSEFSRKLIDLGEKINVNINEKQAEELFRYMNLLIEWNENVNLTAITEPNDVILKHFIDSITIEQYIEKNSRLIDVGTGAGFPGK